MKNYNNFNNDLPKDFIELINIAKSFDNVKDFIYHLNYNERGYNNITFLGERFTRMSRGYEITEIEMYNHININDYVEIFRTGDKPIVWGDYVYIDEEDAKDAFNAGQGNKVYSKETTYKNLKYLSQGSGEFFYAPTELRKYGDTLEDLWYNVNNIEKPKEIIDTPKIDNKNNFENEYQELLYNEKDWEKFEDEYYNLCNKYKINPFDKDIEEDYYNKNNKE